MIPSSTVTVTDSSTTLILHLPEGNYVIHTSSTNRPSGKATAATVRQKMRRGKLVGYVLEALTYDRGPHPIASEMFLDIKLVSPAVRA